VRIGGYETEEELGRGGVAVVYKARQISTGALRAVKVLSSASAGSTAVERFRREAEALARLGGAGIVPVHETGFDGGRLFLVLSLMPGGTLRGRLTRGPLPWRDAVALAVKIARALERCHAQGIVHRDLKPENVLFDDQGEPRLSDFGVARDLGGEGLTKTGDVIGTVHYMAPEQLDARPVDARADVYALGILLHELVAGERPFTRHGSFVQLISERAAGRKEKLPRSAGAPSGLDRLIDRALAPNVEDRPDMAELRSGLEALAEGDESSSRGPVAVVILGVVVAAAIALGVLWHSHGGAPPAAPPPPSVLPPPPPPPPPVSKEDDARAAHARVLRLVQAGERPAPADLLLLTPDMRADVAARAAARAAEFSKDLGGIPDAVKTSELLQRALNGALLARALGGKLDDTVVERITLECEVCARNKNVMPRIDAAAWLAESEPLKAVIIALAAIERGGVAADEAVAIVKSAVAAARGGEVWHCRTYECAVLCHVGRVAEAFEMGIQIFSSPDAQKERGFVRLDLCRLGVLHPGLEVDPALLDRLVAAAPEDPRPRSVRMLLTRDPSIARDDAAFVLDQEKEPVPEIQQKAREILGQ
jgi:hypothetical protein